MKFILWGFIALWALASCSEKPLDNQSSDAEKDQPRLKSASLNYYVSTSGSDSNPGTSASPFRTIQKAADVVNPGDTVVIRDGVYSTTAQYFVNINRGGASGSYVTFKAEHKWGAVLDGGNVSSYGINLGAGVSYIQFVDLEIKNFLWMGIFCNNGTSLSNYITIKGCKIHDIGRVFDQGDYGRCAIYFSRGNHHWTITQNYIYNTGRTNTTDNFRMNKDHAVYIGTASSSADASHDNVITYNVMYSTSGNTLNIGSYNDLIANNVSAWPNRNLAGGSCFIVSEGAGGYGLTIANNIIYGLDPNFAFAILSWTGYSGWTVKNNMVYNGTMWASAGAGQSAMAGNNYGLTDCERSSVDPQFVSPSLSNVDLCIKSTSPAVNAGASIGLTADIQGKSISGTPDIGAFEYGAQAPTPTTYYNKALSTTASKNDCASGSTGSTVTYTVAAGKYSSTVSQADADSKASADLSANAQTYANTNGTCTAATVYYNKAVSATATKNNCTTGSTGSAVTYTVAAGKYSSTVSQADADSKASADLTANTQTYANTNGTCTAPTVYYNKVLSASATKNDCPSGSTGSTVTYSVAAGKYNSTVSQADADSKAAADLSSNTQTYANNTGTCTAVAPAPTVYYNTAISATVMKNNCPRGFKGSYVTYTVAAKTYSSTISQADADSKARYDLSINKQVYANDNGNCTRKFYKR